MKSIDYEVGDIEINLKNEGSKRSRIAEKEDDMVNYATNDRNHLTAKSGSLDEFVQMPPPSSNFAANSKKPVIVRSVNKSNRVVNTGPATFSSDRNQSNFISELDMMLQKTLQKSEQKYQQLSSDMEKNKPKKENKKLSYDE